MTINNHYKARLVGAMVSLCAFSLALVAILKGSPDPYSRFASLPNTSQVGRYVWGRMPAIVFPFRNWADLVQSLPGIIAILMTYIGLVIALGPYGQKAKKQRWEGKP